MGCLHICKWPVTYLMTLSNWTMSCLPRARHGQWPRWQQRPVGYTFPYKMANFHSVYLKLGCINSAEFFIWYSEMCLYYCHKILKWYDKPVRCYRQVKICSFAMSKQGRSDYFHLHVPAPPAAVPGCVDERMIINLTYVFKWNSCEGRSLFLCWKEIMMEQKKSSIMSGSIYISCNIVSVGWLNCS